MEDRDYLAKLTNMFTPQQIPMSPTPSIVTADEDQTIYMAQQSQPAQMPQQSFPAGMYNPDPQMSVAPPAGVNLNARNMGVSPPAPTASVRPMPRPEVPPVPEMGVGTPVPPIEPPTATGVPELDAPGTLVPPETNQTLYEEGLKTLSQMSQNPTVQKGSGVGDVSETKTVMGETLYSRDNPERRGGSYRGEGTPMSNRERNMRARERFHANRQRNLGDAEAAAIEDGTATRTVFGEILYSNPNPERRGGNNNLPTSGEAPTEPTAPDGRFNPEMPDDTVLPGQENMVPHADEESAAAMETVIQAMPPAEAGAPAGVETPDGNVKAVTQEDAKRVAAEDPVGFSKALNWFEKTFGITGQDLARFALFYVGSRLAGYKHGESMSWAFQASAGFLENRVNAANQLASGGKYTPESIEEFRRTGDTSVLKLAKGEGASQKIDFTNRVEMLVDGKATPMTVYEATDGTNKYYVDANGAPVNGRIVDSEDMIKDRDKMIEDAGNTYGDVLSYHLGSKDGDVPGVNFDPQNQGRAVAEAMYVWSTRTGVSPDSGAAKQIVERAAQQAKAWLAANRGKSGFMGIGGEEGAVLNDIVPFINAQMIYQDEHSTWAGALKEDGKRLNPEQLFELNEILEGYIRSDPSVWGNVEQEDRGAVLDKAYTGLYQHYLKMPAEERARYEKENGFYSFLQTLTTTTRE